MRSASSICDTTCGMDTCTWQALAFKLKWCGKPGFAAIAALIATGTDAGGINNQTTNIQHRLGMGRRMDCERDLEMHGAGVAIWWVTRQYFLRYIVMIGNSSWLARGCAEP
eukprot:1162143-Pelagomonas_calceolata.AAC.8